MSSLRQDPPHGSKTPEIPAGSGHWKRRPAGREAVLSIIVPAKNEAESLPQLVAEIAEAFRPLVGRGVDQGNPLRGFEILVIDDGSTDETPSVLRALRELYPELRPIHFDRNYGQSAATMAGFHEASGAWVAILDADLQNDPSDLARLWDLLPGFDAVLGWRIKREDVWSKRIISRWANRVRNRILGQAIKDTGCSVRIFPRAAALRFPIFHGVHRFYGPLLLREGCSIRQEPVQHRPRPHGASHYSLRNRSLNVVLDLFGVAWLMRRSVQYGIVPATGASEERSQANTPHLSSTTARREA